MAETQNLTVDEVASWLGVTPRTVYRLVQGGRLPGFKVGGQWRFSRDILDRWVADQVTVEQLRAEDAQNQSNGSSPQR